MEAMAVQPAKEAGNKGTAGPKAQNNAKASSASGASIISNVVAKLKEAKNIKSKEQSVSTRKKEEALAKASDFLLELNKQTGGRYKNDISSLSKKIIGKRRTLIYVEKDINNNYVSTWTASRELEKLIQDAEKLKSKIK